jgi:hypothetical protein
MRNSAGLLETATKPMHAIADLEQDFRERLRALTAAWPDGGWNCDARARGRRSSFHESLTPAWGLFEYWQATGDADARQAALRAAELFLQPADRTREQETERILALGARSRPITGGPMAAAGSRSPIRKATRQPAQGNDVKQCESCAVPCALALSAAGAYLGCGPGACPV